MAYYDVALLSGDADFLYRVTAAYATDHLEIANEAASWAEQHRWNLAAQPGFGDAYASAIAGGVPDPGRDPSVISDAQILSAVQAIDADQG
jgi:hypothetical protein